MSGAHVRLVLFVICAAALLAGGCGSCERESESPPPKAPAAHDLRFAAPGFPAGRTLDTLIEADLDGIDGREYVVTSIARDTFVPPIARADLIAVYRYDSTARRWGVVMSDTMHWSTGLELRDVTGDGVADLIARIHSGGNDPIVSEGLNIYSTDGGRMRPVFRSSRGSPSIETAGGTARDSARGVTIRTRDQLWPIFATHAESFTYLNDVFGYREGRFTSILNEQRPRFRNLAQKNLERYRTVRDSVATIDTLTHEDGIRLFNAAAVTMLTAERADAARLIRSFWESEQAFLEAKLPEVEFEELKALYGRTMHL